MPNVLYLCDHKYDCANSLFCELNGGDCMHTGQRNHSRNNIHITDISTDLRFEKMPQATDPLRYIYIEKVDSQEKQLPL